LVRQTMRYCRGNATSSAARSGAVPQADPGSPHRGRTRARGSDRSKDVEIVAFERRGGRVPHGQDITARGRDHAAGGHLPPCRIQRSAPRLWDGLCRRQFKKSTPTLSSREAAFVCPRVRTTYSPFRPAVRLMSAQSAILTRRWFTGGGHAGKFVDDTWWHCRLFVLWDRLGWVLRSDVLVLGR